MNELFEIKNLLIAYKARFARKNKHPNPQDWYPNSAKDLENLLNDFIKFEEGANKYKKELTFFLNSSHVQVIEEDLALKAKDKDRNHEPWLNDSRKIWVNANNTNSQFAFFKSKTEQKLGAAFKSLDLSTDRTLEELEDPRRPGKWDTKAMIIGDVQSGKTSDYNGLIAKAIDTGYKVIIVLAGSYNSLRAQTQIRLENTLISTQQNGECNKALFLTKKAEYIDKDGIRIISRSNDFNTTAASTTGLAEEDVTVIVCKKHVSVLASILIWLNNQDMEKNTKIDWSWENKKGRGWTDYVKEKLPKNPPQCKLPLLLIDDECDSASLDISARKTKISDMEEKEKEHFYQTDPSKTNMLIRRILGSFNKNTYIGYTATPLANIFINHESFKQRDGMDIFPEDFVKLLPRHPDYIGIEHIFGKAERNFNEDDEVVSLSEDLKEEDSPNVKWIYDYRDDFSVPNDHPTEEERDKKYREEARSKDIKGWMPLYHKNGFMPFFKGTRTIPETLEQAIKLFIMNIAIRYFRSNINDHNSMLVHVSRFTLVQKEVEHQISEYLKEIINIVNLSLDQDKKNQLKKSFKLLWENEILKKIDDQKYPETNKIKFDDIWAKIIKIICDESNPIDVLQINSMSEDSLDYETKEKGGKNWNIIVIGGAAVSRGITLEGLSISYFSRLAKKPTSDTLIQMGRWFGYRKGYEDIFRVFCPKILHILFRQFSFTYEKARDHFVELSAPPPKSPKDYAFEIPCFDGWNLVSKQKGKDITIIKEPFSSFLSKSHTPIHYFKDKRREENNLLIEKLITSLPKEFETEKEINERLRKGNLWIPLRLDTPIDHKLSKEEILNKIPKERKVNLQKAFLWKDIQADKLIDFLTQYQSPRDLNDWTPKILAAKLNLLKHKKDLLWNIGIMGIKGRNGKNFKFKNNIETTTQIRTVTYDSYDKEIAKISTLSVPLADYIDLDKKSFDKGIDGWINLFQKTGKFTYVSNNFLTKRKSNFYPANFKQKIRQYKKNGLFLIYPFTPDEKNINELYFGWQIIIPPTRAEGDADSLIYNTAVNQAGLEHRKIELDSILRPIQN